MDHRINGRRETDETTASGGVVKVNKTTMRYRNGGNKKMCNEVWKPVVGYEGFYRVSNRGNIRRENKPVNLKPGVAGGGTLIVALSKNGQRKNKQIKRLVWEAFNGPCNDKVIQLRDGNPNNCCLENLRAVSKDEHLKKTIEAAINKTRTPVDQYLGGVFVASYTSMHEAERKTGIPQNHISEVCRGVLKTAGGYSWRYQKPQNEPVRDEIRSKDERVR